MAHRLFAKQLKEASGPDGVDVERLGELVSAAYDQMDRDRRRTQRSMSLMIDEIDGLNNADREALLRELRTQNIRFEAALDNMAQGLAMYDGEWRLIVCNRVYAEMYRLPEELTRPGTTFEMIVSSRVESDTWTRVDAPFVSNPWTSDAPATYQRELSDGRIILISRRPLAGGGWVATHEDVTEQRRSEARIVHMAYHDALTDLPNRQFFYERLAEQFLRARRGSTLAVLSLDLDNFKAVNDTLGHPVGDRLLLMAAQRIVETVRDTDTVARFGGDEFFILQADAEQPSGAAALAERLVTSLRKPYYIDGHEIVASSSIGVALAPQDGDDSDTLLKNADLALYAAKGDGRDGFRLFEPRMDQRVRERRALEVDLRRALDQGEFELAYQPVFDLRSKEIVRVEALLRWRHPERGTVLPGEFIPIAEEIGFIHLLGDWVIRQACRDAARWPDSIGVSVNLSAPHFHNLQLVNLAVSACANAGISPQRLTLEITESALIKDSERTLATLRQLRSMGMRISLDDFGTGYSSLSYLRRYPFDEIKIDRSFVSELPGGVDSLSIVRAIIGLGASLGIPITAEGVESAAQAECLLAEGCRAAQGYFLCRPRPIAELMPLLAAGEAGGRAVA